MSSTYFRQRMGTAAFRSPYMNGLMSTNGSASSILCVSSVLPLLLLLLPTIIVTIIVSLIIL